MLVQKSYMSVQKSPAQREPEKFEKSSKVKKLRKEFEKKIFNNSGKKLKLKESLEKNVGKIGEKKVEKKVKKILCWYKKLYVSKKSLARKEAKKS